MVSLPDNRFVRQALEKQGFFIAIDFFLNETVHLVGADTKGQRIQIEGRVIKINNAVDPPGEAKQDWRIIQDIARAMGENAVSLSPNRARFWMNCVSRRKAASPITPASHTKRLKSKRRLLAVYQ